MSEANLKDYNNNDIFWREFSNLPGSPYKLNTSLNGFKCLLVFFVKSGDLSKNDWPLPLGYMASLVRMNTGKATILIQDIERYNKDSFSNYDLICFYPMVALFQQTLEIARKVKEDFPSSKICFFNSDQHQHEKLFCNPMAREIGRVVMERYPFVDYILIDEAESSFIRLCDKLFKKETNFSDMPACLYREDGKIKLSEKPIETVKFDFLPFPARDFLEKTINPEGINTHSPRVQSSRGCMAQCLYCAESGANIISGGRKMPVLSRDIIRFVDEIEMLYREYKIIFFNIIDSSLEDPGKKGIERMNLFFDEILRRDIRASFKIHMRIETFDNLDDAFLKKMKDAGVDIIITGIESTVERELSSYKRKSITIEKDKATLRRIDNLDYFFTLTGHMMFSALLRLEDLKEKVKFMKEYNRSWDYLLMSINLLAYKGTGFHDFLKKTNLVLESDEMSPMVPYKFEDERIGYITKEVGGLRKRCHEVILLHNLLYDSMNLKSRYKNKMNQHLWKDEKPFLAFKQELQNTLDAVGEVYVQYFTELIKLAEEGWTSEKAERIYEAYIPNFFPGTFNRMNDAIKTFIQSYEEQGLSTSKLYLKTWISFINAQVNPSGGKVAG